MASNQPVSGWRGLPPLPSAHRPILHAGASRHIGGLPRTPAAKARRARGLPLATRGDRSPVPGGADDAEVAPPRWLVLGSRGSAGGTPAVHRSISPVAVTAEPRGADASYAGFHGTDVTPTPRPSSVAAAAAGALALGPPPDAAFAAEHKASAFGRDGGAGASASLAAPHLPRPGTVARSVREDAAAGSKRWSPTAAATVGAAPAESTFDISTTRASAVPAMTPRPGSPAMAARTGQAAGSAMQREMGRARSSSPRSDVAAVPTVRPTPSSSSPAEPPRSSIRGDATETAPVGPSAAPIRGHTRTSARPDVSAFTVSAAAGQRMVRSSPVFGAAAGQRMVRSSPVFGAAAGTSGPHPGVDRPPPAPSIGTARPSGVLGSAHPGHQASPPSPGPGALAMALRRQTRHPESAVPRPSDGAPLQDISDRWTLSRRWDHGPTAAAFGAGATAPAYGGLETIRRVPLASPRPARESNTTAPLEPALRDRAGSPTWGGIPRDVPRVAVPTVLSSMFAGRRGVIPSAGAGRSRLSGHSTGIGSNVASARRSRRIGRTGVAGGATGSPSVAAPDPRRLTVDRKGVAAAPAASAGSRDNRSPTRHPGLQLLRSVAVGSTASAPATAPTTAAGGSPLPPSSGMTLPIAVSRLPSRNDASKEGSATGRPGFPPSVADGRGVGYRASATRHNGEPERPPTSKDVTRRQHTARSADARRSTANLRNHMIRRATPPRPTPQRGDSQGVPPPAATRPGSGRKAAGRRIGNPPSLLHHRRGPTPLGGALRRSTALPSGSNHRRSAPQQRNETLAPRATAPTQLTSGRSISEAPVRPSVVPRHRGAGGRDGAQPSGPGVIVTRDSRGGGPVVRKHDNAAAPPPVRRQIAGPDGSSSVSDASSGGAADNETKKAEAQKSGSNSRKLTEFTDLVEAIEDRVLAQLERRGGRYQGAF